MIYGPLRQTKLYKIFDNQPKVLSHLSMGNVGKFYHTSPTYHKSKKCRKLLRWKPLLHLVLIPTTWRKTQVLSCPHRKPRRPRRRVHASWHLCSSYNLRFCSKRASMVPSKKKTHITTLITINNYSSPIITINYLVLALQPHHHKIGSKVAPSGFLPLQPAQPG